MGKSQILSIVSIVCNEQEIFDICNAHGFSDFRQAIRSDRKGNTQYCYHVESERVDEFKMLAQQIEAKAFN